MRISQPTINPTNKLTAATLGIAILNVTRVIVENIWPNTTDEALWIALDPVVVFALGWFIRDEANSTAVVVETPAKADEPAKT